MKHSHLRRRYGQDTSSSHVSLDVLHYVTRTRAKITSTDPSTNFVQSQSLLRRTRLPTVRLISALNYFTAEVTGTKTPGVYAVFFEVLRDKRRKRRLLLYVQSAYRLERRTNRLAKGGKVRFATLLGKA